jgi:hypothetical protein
MVRITDFFYSLGDILLLRWKWIAGIALVVVLGVGIFVVASGGGGGSPYRGVTVYPSVPTSLISSPCGKAKVALSNFIYSNPSRGSNSVPAPVVRANYEVLLSRYQSACTSYSADVNTFTTNTINPWLLAYGLPALPVTPLPVGGASSAVARPGPRITANSSQPLGQS